MPKEFDPKDAAKHGYTRDDWDAVDSPEITDEQLKTATTFEKAAPELAAKFKKTIARRGRPPSENPKQAISIRLDQDLIEAMKASGPGWQSRANKDLRKANGI